MTDLSSSSIRIEEIKKELAALTEKQLLLQRELNDLIFELPYWYGKCTNKLVLPVNLSHNPECTITIRVGEVIEFTKIYGDQVIHYVNSCEYIVVPFSHGHFSFFQGKDVESRKFYRD